MTDLTVPTAQPADATSCEGLISESGRALGNPTYESGFRAGRAEKDAETSALHAEVMVLRNAANSFDPDPAIVDVRRRAQAYADGRSETLSREDICFLVADNNRRGAQLLGSREVLAAQTATIEDLRDLIVAGARRALIEPVDAEDAVEQDIALVVGLREALTARRHEQELA